MLHCLSTTIVMKKIKAVSQEQFPSGLQIVPVLAKQERLDFFHIFRSRTNN